MPSVALSSPVDALLPQTWIALLRGRVRSALAATSGVEDAADVARYLLAGADVVMTASALLRHGPGHATVLLDGLTAWMARKGFESVDELRGMLVGAARDRRGCIRARRLHERDEGRKRPLLQCVVSVVVRQSGRAGAVTGLGVGQQLSVGRDGWLLCSAGGSEFTDDHVDCAAASEGQS